MPFDYKKEYKEYYIPPQKPVIVDIPKMNYIAVRGIGNRHYTPKITPRNLFKRPSQS